MSAPHPHKELLERAQAAADEAKEHAHARRAWEGDDIARGRALLTVVASAVHSLSSALTEATERKGLDEDARHELFTLRQQKYDAHNRLDAFGAPRPDKATVAYRIELLAEEHAATLAAATRREEALREALSREAVIDVFAAALERLDWRGSGCPVPCDGCINIFTARCEVQEVLNLALTTTPEPPAVPEPAAAPLMTALRASVADARKAKDRQTKGEDQ